MFLLVQQYTHVLCQAWFAAELLTAFPWHSLKPDKSGSYFCQNASFAGALSPAHGNKLRHQIPIHLEQSSKTYEAQHTCCLCGKNKLFYTFK